GAAEAGVVVLLTRDDVVRPRLEARVRPGAARRLAGRLIRHGRARGVVPADGAAIEPRSIRLVIADDQIAGAVDGVGAALAVHDLDVHAGEAHRGLAVVRDDRDLRELRLEVVDRGGLRFDGR